MKLLCFTLCIILCCFAFAQDTDDIVKDLKNAEIERDFVLSDNEFKDCSKPEDKDIKFDAVKDCVKKKVDVLEEETLQEFSQKYKLKSFNPEAAKSKKSLQDYLAERIQNAIYGTKLNEKMKLKDMKYVDQKQFFELYKNQIGKNVLLEIARYALENFDLNSGYDGSQFLLDMPKDYFKTKTLKETQRCLKDSPKSPADCRSTKELTDFKKKQLEMAQLNPKNLGDHFANMGPYIGHACEYYRCENVYSDAVSEDIKTNCINMYGKKPSQAYSSSSSALEKSNNMNKLVPGQIACAVENRMKSYRNTIAKVDEMLESFKKGDHQGKSGFELTTTYQSQFSAGNGDDKTLDEITAISSKELIENVDELNSKKLEDQGKKFNEECFDGDGNLIKQNSECVDNLTSSMSQEKMDKLVLDEKVQTQIYLEELEKLKAKAAKDKNELKKFLDKHGLSKKYPTLDGINVNEVIELIKGKYAAERLSIIENLKSKFKRETSVKQDDAKSIAKFATEQIEKNKETATSIETLFNYSNIASSYLAVKDGDSAHAKVSENTVMRSIESSGFDEYAKDEKNEYDKFFEDIDPSQGTSSSADVEVDFIDDIIGNSSSED